MRIPDAMVTSLLLDNGKATQDKLDELIEIGKKQKKPLQKVVIEKQVVSESDLAKLYADEIDVPFIDLSEVEIPKDVLKQIPQRIAEKYNAVLFESDDKHKKLALDDPDDLQAVDFLSKQFGKGKVEIFLATTRDIHAALGDYKGSISSELSKVVPGDEEAELEIDDEEVSEEDLAEDSPIAQTVNLLIEYAIKAKASDIHIEPREEFVQVRYRVDGVLREANKLPRRVMAALVSRIKILSSLKIDEHRAPQDGRFKISFGEDIFALRVSTLPVVDGEKVVMRILDESTEALTLEDLGFWGKSLDDINSAIAQPHGIVLVTGPTGSGKSTTLYSVLSKLNTPGVNISTIEDPVEYRIPGVNQTQTNPKAGMTFANGLRALLRQDPNIIMIGEIRDAETAALAIQAALTGHLVFATLHTNNAATAIPRLLDMGAEPFLIASTLQVVIGQRLVRRLDTETRESYTPDKKELENIQETFKIKEAIEKANDAQKAHQETLKQQEEAKKKEKGSHAEGGNKVIAPLAKDLDDESIVEKLKNDPNMADRSADEAAAKQAAKQARNRDPEHESKEVVDDSLPTNSSKMSLWRPASDIDTSGYKGRVGIYEVLRITEPVEKLIAGSATASDIQRQAIQEGMMTMSQDGFVKVLQGLTSIEEIMRATRE